MKGDWNTWGDLLQVLNDTFGVLRRYGIELVPGCRYARYKRLLELVSSGRRDELRQTPQAMLRLLQACVEIRELSQIVGVFAQPHFGDQHIARIRRIALKGNELPAGNPELGVGTERTSRARDCQFETYCGALCRMAQLEPRFTEPDVVAKVEGVSLGIAAKRVKSRKRINERVRQATNQIEQRRKPGVIMIHASIAAHDDLRLWRLDLANVRSKASAITEGICDEIKRAELATDRSRWTYGYCVIVDTLYRDTGGHAGILRVARGRARLQAPKYVKRIHQAFFDAIDPFLDLTLRHTEPSR